MDKALSNGIFVVPRYLRDVFRTAQHRPLEESDLFDTLDEHRSAPIGDNFTKLWDQELSKRKKPNIFYVINKAYGLKVIGAGFMFSIIEIICRWIESVNNNIDLVYV